MAMANFPSVDGMYLIGGSDGEFGVRKTNDPTYLKDNVIPGFSEDSSTQYIQLIEGTNFSYASIEYKQILKLELVNFETFVKVGEYTRTFSYLARYNGARRGKRLMFTSEETGKLLHTVDGTNNVAVRIDDIKVNYFSVPSFYTEEKLFFLSYYGIRSRRNYDYVVEIEIDSDNSGEGPILEIKGTNTFVISLLEG